MKTKACLVRADLNLPVACSYCTGIYVKILFLISVYVIFNHVKFQ